MKYEGVSFNERANMSDADFIDLIIRILGENKIEVLKPGIKVERFKALPDTLEQFQTYFIDNDSDELKTQICLKEG